MPQVLDQVGNRREVPRTAHHGCDGGREGLRRPARQFLSGKAIGASATTRYTKLYLLVRQAPVAPIVGYVGSSNLTFSDLSLQGKLTSTSLTMTNHRSTDT